MNRKQESKIKTHEEIMAIFKEFESFEEDLKSPETFEEKLVEFEVVREEPEEPEVISEIIKEKNKRVIFPFKIRKRKKPEKHRLETRYKNTFFNKIIKRFNRIQSTESEVEFFETTSDIKPRSTFTLKINEEGELVGFNIKKPKKGKKHRRILPFKKGKSKEPEVEKSKPSGIKRKIIAITSHFRRSKGESEGEEPKSPGIKGKLKGILPRRKKSE